MLDARHLAPTSPAGSTPATRATLRRTCALAAERGVVVGAQVGYRDLAGFGRRFIDVEPGRADRRRALPDRRARRDLPASPARGALREAARRAVQRDRPPRGAGRRGGRRPCAPTTRRCRCSGCPARCSSRAAEAAGLRDGARVLRRPRLHAGGHAGARARSRARCCTTRRRSPRGCCGWSTGRRGHRGGRHRSCAVGAESVCVHGDSPGRGGDGHARSGRAWTRGRGACAPFAGADGVDPVRACCRGAAGATRRCSSRSTGLRRGARALRRRRARGAAGRRARRRPGRAHGAAHRRRPGAPTSPRSAPRGARTCDVDAGARAAAEARTGVEIAGRLRRPGPRRGRPSSPGSAPTSVVAAHTGTPWRVAFGGFAPGFAYLAGGDPRLRRRRAAREPRTSRAGRGGRAGRASSAASTRASSPGGWQLIGRTDAVLWDTRPRPAGAAATRVHRSASSVEATGERPRERTRQRAWRCSPTGRWRSSRTSAGPGSRALGVGRSGAADRAALRLANRLVGNADGRRRHRGARSAASPCARTALRTVALAGAPAPATVDGTPVAHHAVVIVRPGQTLRSARRRPACAPTSPCAAASRSTPSSARAAPTPSPASARRRSQPGDVLPSAPSRERAPGVDLAPVAPPTGRHRHAPRVPRPPRRLVRRPRPRSPAPPGRSPAAATGSACASKASPCARSRTSAELPSEGMVRGAIQVPPGGRAGALPRRPPGDRRLPRRRGARRPTRRPRPPSQCAPVRRCGLRQAALAVLTATWLR